MTVEYVSVEDAIARDGLRMVVVGGIPSPWGEAAKSIFHIKRIPWVAVRLAYDSEALKQWTGQRNGPVAMYRDEPPRSGWAEILELAERLAPQPAQWPADAAQRAAMLALAGEICGPGGLGWTRRLQLVHAGLQGNGGFAAPAAKYLAKRYGYEADAAASYGPRVVELLGALSAQLHAQREAGSVYAMGHALSAIDVYCATFIALFRPLPQDQCAMDSATRDAFETVDADTAAALDPILLEHRDMMYARHLELPLSL
ncbi:MAG: hypothetical protein ABI702_21900 [Burkholderiales bacterium]